MNTAGTSVNSGNAKRIVGKVVYQDLDQAPARCTVKLRSVLFLKDTASAGLNKTAISQIDTTTDGQGNFVIDSVDTGRYYIEVNDEKGKAVRMDCNVSSDPNSLLLDTLRPTGVIAGSIIPYDSSVSYVQIYGLDRAVKVQPATGKFTIDNIPQGNYEIRLTTAGVPTQVVDSVAVPSADTIKVASSPWQFSKKIILNTTAGGAAVAGNVYGFPILVRLTSAIFNFSQALANGDDIRFTKPDNTPLPFEIERWDASAGSAEVWVKVDTILGNNNVQFITMYWGNAAAATQSASSSVFDTAAGFQAVWHMEKTSTSTVTDASGNHFNGVLSDTAPVAITGQIGDAFSFNGVSSYITIPNSAGGKLNLAPQGRYSVSAWAMIDSFPVVVKGVNDHIDIVAKGNFDYHLQNVAAKWQFVEFQDLKGWIEVLSPLSATAGEWALVTGVRDGTQEFLYVNGICVDSTVSLAADSSQRIETIDVSIGRLNSPATYYFPGKIDEVRIESVPRSADWVRLCYINQKVQDALLIFGP
jgi:hypothetical protein